MACSAPLPPPKVDRAKVVRQAPSTPPPPPARWVEIGATVIGPTLPEGTLVLLGGRRALVAPDGSAKAAADPTPEPLLGLIEVPTKDGCNKVIAHSRHGVYRLDTPLGPVTTLAHTPGHTLVASIGAGPGKVAVWLSGAGKPVFLSVETGQPESVPSLPALPATQMAFRSLREGACLFEGSNRLYTTTDGGASWAPDTQSGLDPTRMIRYLKPLNGAVLAGVDSDDRDLPAEEPIVFASEKEVVGPTCPARPAPAARQATDRVPPVLDWIARTHADPLESAVRDGVLLPSGEALIAAKGLLATVDLESGLVLRAEPAPTGKDWVLRGGGPSILLGGQLSDENDRQRLFGLHAFSSTDKVVADLPLFKPRQRPLKIKDFAAQFKVDPSGAAIVYGPCDMQDEIEGVCVRQPDATWKTVRPEVGTPANNHWWGRGIAPLSDGGAVYLRGLTPLDRPRDTPPPGDAAPTVPEGGLADAEAPRAQGRELWMVRVSPCGDEETIATIRWPEAEELDISVETDIQEGDDHRLRVLLRSSLGDLGLVTVARGASRVQVTPETFKDVTLKLYGRLLAAQDGKGGVRVSTDGGVVWSEVSLPGRLARGLGSAGLAEREGPSSPEDDPVEDWISISAVGLRVDRFVRIGWGSDVPLREEAPSGGISLSPATTTSRDPMIVCTEEGPGTGTPLWQPDDLPRFFKAGEPQPGHKQWLDPTGLLPEGPVGAILADGLKSARHPATLRFYWFDPTEIGAKPRQVLLPAPKDASWSTFLGALQISSGRAVFQLLDRQKYAWSLGVTMGTTVSLTPIPPVLADLLPDEGIVPGRDGALAWVNRAGIMGWKPGSERWFAPFRGHFRVFLAPSTDQGIPVLAMASDWAAVTTLKPPAKASDSPDLGLGGWESVRASSSDLFDLKACEKDAKGPTFRAPLDQRAKIALGSDQWTEHVFVDLRIDAPTACIAGVYARWGSPDRRYATILRYDALNKRAEKVTAEGVRALHCDLP